MSVAADPTKGPSVSSLENDVKTKEEFKYSSELEDSAKTWIKSVLKDDTLFVGQSFAQTLKTGVVLCKYVLLYYKRVAIGDCH